ncbi:MAG: hypothetical protein HOO96_23575 [Polyangiaceae bacterium]|nr:hypothetical protein [Polyangiaceae bacterium]
MRPRAVRNRRARAVTLVEVLNLLTLGAVVAALAMYGVARYTQHSKTAEAMSAVSTLAKNAATYYDASDATQPLGAAPDAAHAMRHFPTSAKTPVPEDAKLVEGKRYRSSSADWSRPPWKDLGFSIVQPQCYAYNFTSDGSGAQAKATATAQGDLDGDGERSYFSLSVTPDGKLNAVVAPTVETKNTEE